MILYYNDRVSKRPVNMIYIIVSYGCHPIARSQDNDCNLVVSVKWDLCSLDLYLQHWLTAPWSSVFDCGVNTAAVRVRK